MAYKNKTIYNPVTGQSITFIQTSSDSGGGLLEMEVTFNKHSKEPALHYHPRQDECFTVIKGELTIRINGSVKVYKAGSIIHINRNTVHSMWNNSTEKVIVNWRVEPALNTEYFLENVAGLAVNGKTNKMGKPGLLQVALMATEFSSIFRLAKPSFFIQKIVFGLLTPFAYIKGLKPAYKKYEN